MLNVVLVCNLDIAVHYISKAALGKLCTQVTCMVQACNDPDYVSGSVTPFLGFAQVSCSRRVLKHTQCDPCRQMLRSRSAVKSADFQQ